VRSGSWKKPSDTAKGTTVFKRYRAWHGTGSFKANSRKLHTKERTLRRREKRFNGPTEVRIREEEPADNPSVLVSQLSEGENPNSPNNFHKGSKLAAVHAQNASKERCYNREGEDTDHRILQHQSRTQKKNPPLEKHHNKTLIIRDYRWVLWRGFSTLPDIPGIQHMMSIKLDIKHHATTHGVLETDLNRMLLKKGKKTNGTVGGASP